MATVVAYVDGFNLYHGLHQAYGRRYLWLDLQHLVQLVRPRDQVLAVRYFTAEVKDDRDGLERQRTYLAALKTHCSTIDVVLGRYQTKTMACRQCGSSWTSYEEKETDVNIAVSLVADAAASASDIALIISADSDLCPAIRTARSLNPGGGMIAAFPPRRSSFEIRSLIRKPFTLAAADIRNSLLPEVVADPASGLIRKRPDKWR
ncbi:MAG TPA: NYN domain-containing protein [Streptosporangiaceae bacterium]|nr:NYN domain-containing protein [Streptosporangiaceae bacterium]